MGAESWKWQSDAAHQNKDGLIRVRARQVTPPRTRALSVPFLRRDTLGCATLGQRSPLELGPL
eukprot:6842280-Prymnesium_polylepis.3